MAQSPYVATYTRGNYGPIAGTTHVPVGYAFGIDAWDEGAAEIALPFAFEWFGVPYTRLWAFTNGLISFDPPPTNGLPLNPPTVIPNPSGTQHNFIAPMWAGLTGLNALGINQATIRSTTTGTPPNRTFRLELANFRSTQNPMSQATFQVWLEEGSNAVTILYGASTFLANGSTGIENANGQQGENLLRNPPCTGCIGCAPRNCGQLNWPQGLMIRLDRPPDTELVGEISGPSGALPGQMFSATTRVANLGQTAAGAFAAEIRLSTDTTIDATDQLLATVSYPAGLDRSQTSTRTVSLTMPMGLPPARFYLGHIVDSGAMVAERVEGNNTSYDAAGIVTGPDLVGTITAPSASGPGEQIDVGLTVRSDGTAVTTPVSVEVFLSADAMFDVSDTWLGSVSVTLPDGQSGSTTTRLAIPASTPTGSYRVLAVIDRGGAVDETDESNNVAVAMLPLVLSAPDLVAGTLVAPSRMFRGVAQPLSATIRNAGGTPARQFRVCAVLSRDATIDPSTDVRLTSTSSVSLLGGESAAIRLEPSVPMSTPTGSWYVALFADCDGVVPEMDETNNAAVSSAPITVLDPSPDLSPVEIQTTTAAAAGEALAVSVSVANLGQRDASSTVQLVLSETSGVSPMDTIIWTTPAPVMFPAGRETVVSAWARLPGDLSSGDYYVGAIVDPANVVSEIDDGNNTLAVGPIPVLGANLAIVGPVPPNGVTGVMYTWRFVAIGSASGYSWQISWASGSAPAGLTFDSALGQLAGVPTAEAEGSHAFTVIASVDGRSASRDFNLNISPPTLPLTVVTARVPPALRGEGYSTQLVAVGGRPPYRWKSGSMAPPFGLEVREDGVLAGLPAGVGGQTFDVIVTDSATTSVSGLIAIDVIDPEAGLSISTVDIPAGTVGNRYRTSFQVTGGVAPYTWKIESDRIPGLEIRAGSTAEVVGTASVAGSYPMIVEVRDSVGLIDRNAYILDVVEPGDLLILNDSLGPLPDATVNEPYLDEDDAPVQLQVERRSGRSLAGLTWSVPAGRLPPGIRLDAQTGLLSGTPTEEGAFAFTVFVHDPGGDNDRATFAILVKSADTTPPPPPPGDEGCSCSTRAPSTGPVGPAGLLGLLLLAGVARRRRR